MTEERLGVYRPEEHIDNPKDYADNVDARKYDERLRPPIQAIELEVDPRTGMKNYIANEDLDIATSAGYVRFSFTRSIHFGRVYTSGASGTKGKEADLCEALRCLGCDTRLLDSLMACAKPSSLGKDCTVWKTSVLTRTIRNSLCVKWDFKASSHIVDPRPRSVYLGLSIQYIRWSRELLGLLTSYTACKSLNP